MWLRVEWVCLLAFADNKASKQVNRDVYLDAIDTTTIIDILLIVTGWVSRWICDEHYELAVIPVTLVRQISSAP